MANEYTERLGCHDGDQYFLTVRARPSFDRPVEFGVVVHYHDNTVDSNVEIARVDTAHGRVHFDKLYRRDQPKERLDVGLWEAVTKLRNDWRRYAEIYERD